MMMNLIKGNIWQEGLCKKCGAENDDKKSMEEVDEIVVDNSYEHDHVKFLDEKEERSSQSFEVEVKEITESKAEQPVIEKIRSEQQADEGHGIEAVVKGGEKQSSNIEKETPLKDDNVKAKEELVREIRQNVKNVNARRKQKKKTKLKIEGTTKGKD
ncbi:hypothetical protein REPUB_Repub06bG0094400 [Reevesia pubescens]